MTTSYPNHAGMQPQSMPHHPMAPGPNPGQPGMAHMQMHPGVSGPNGPVSQAGPMMAGMQPGVGPSAHALSHLQPQQAAAAHMFQQQQQQQQHMQSRLNFPFRANESLTSDSSESCHDAATTTGNIPAATTAAADAGPTAATERHGNGISSEHGRGHESPADCRIASWKHGTTRCLCHSTAPPSPIATAAATAATAHATAAAATTPAGN